VCRLRACRRKSDQRLLLWSSSLQFASLLLVGLANTSNTCAIEALLEP
jgi:hypothetical protein